MIEEPVTVLDKNGTKIKPGQIVRIYQDLCIRFGMVDTVSTIPTVNEPGYWVDVIINNGLAEGIPSYILEIVIGVQPSIYDRIVRYAEIFLRSVIKTIRILDKR